MPDRNTEILLWTIVECCIGLVCACIPCMTPLSRLITVGPIAAFSSRQRKSAPTTVALENHKGGKNPKPRPPLGARRLPSVEDSRTALSPGGGRHHIELGEWSDRRDLREDSTTLSESQREWLDVTMPGPENDTLGACKGQSGKRH